MMTRKGLEKERNSTTCLSSTQDTLQDIHNPLDIFKIDYHPSM